MTFRVRHLALFCIVFAALAGSAPALASPDDVIRDCANDGSLDEEHSDADKRAALDQLPSDLDEYSDCRSVISGSIGKGPKAGASKNRGAGGDAAGTGSASARAKQARKRRAARKRAEKRRQTEAALGDSGSGPGSADAVRTSETSGGLPLPVLLALIALALLAAAAGVVTLGKRNQGVGSALRRVPLLFSRR